MVQTQVIKAATLDDLHTLSKGCGVKVVIFTTGDLLDSCFYPDYREIKIHFGSCRDQRVRGFNRDHVAVVVGLHELGHAYGYQKSNDQYYRPLIRTHLDTVMVLKEERRAWKWALAHTHESLLPVFYHTFKLGMGSYVRDWIRSRPERRKVERTLFWQGILTGATWTSPTKKSDQVAQLIPETVPAGTKLVVMDSVTSMASAYHQSASQGGGNASAPAGGLPPVPVECRKAPSSTACDYHDGRGT